MPTKVVNGIGCIKANKDIFASFGKKAMIVTGRTSARKNGSLADVEDVLKELSISYVIFDRIMSNPTIDCVYEGAELAKSEHADFIISIGGGSPMDAGKAIALLAAQEVARADLFSGKYENKVLPMIHIPTTAGTGSEVTQYAILTNDEKQTKTSVASPYLFPTVALCDPTYMMGLRKNITINTTVDALSHAVEGMLTKRANPLSDTLALESIRMITKHMDSLKNDTLTIEERGELLYASTLAGMVIAHTGTTAVHSMGYSLTYFKGLDHGRANGLLLAEFLRFVEKSDAKKIGQILQAMNLESVQEFAVLMNELMGAKEHLTDEEIESYAEIAIKAKNIKNCNVEPTKEDIIQIYFTSLHA